jgi:serine/threonine-protein kinase RsbW
VDEAPTLRVDASLDVLAEVRAFVRSVLGDLGADKGAVSALVQSVDEWVTNVVVHGYGEAPGPVSVSARREAGDVVVVVRDEAPAYDPATAPAFDRDQPLEQRPFGGMGMALIKDLCTEFEHRTLSGPPPGVGNEVTMRRAALTGGTK